VKKLRVLHVNLSPGGIGRYGALFADALAKRDDIEVLSVFNSALANSEPLRKIINGFDKVEFLSQTYAQKAKLFLSLRQILNSWRPDVVHDTAGSGFVYGVFALASAARRFPLLITEHDPEPHLDMGISLPSRLARFLIRRLGDHIFVHGPLCRATLIRQGLSPSKVTVIRHGHLASLFGHVPLEHIKRDNQTILFFGALRPNKGVQLIIPIADRIHVKYQGVKFIVAGSPNVSRDLRKSSWPGKLKHLLKEMRKRPYFEVHDRFISDEEVGVFFQRATITLLPYLDATQSGVAMIAMPLGSVIVATRVGDLPFVIEDGVTGFLANPDVDSIVAKLSYVLSHPADLENVRKNAKAWVEQECDWRRIVMQTTRNYWSFAHQRCEGHVDCF